jgi:iron complex outermembrane recepter protein
MHGRLVAQTSPQGPGAALQPFRGMSLQELMNLDVTSVSKEPQPYADAPAAIDVITSEEIDRSGALTLPEALRLADNLDVAQKNPHDWAISARGFNTDLSNKLLVLMDGRTLYTPLFSGVFWDAQNTLLADIDRIEVISGPGGTLWGSNAVNGVINITTKNARDTQGLLAEEAAGSGLEDLSAARYGGTLGPNVYYRVYGQYLGEDSGRTVDGADAGDGWHTRQGGFRVDADPSPGETLTLQGDLYDGGEGLPGQSPTQTAGGNLLGRWTRGSSADSQMSLQAYYDRTHYVEPVGPLTLDGLDFSPAGVLVDNLATTDVDFQDRLRVGALQKWVWGLGARYMADRVQNAPALGFLPENLDQRLLSAFAQDEIELAKSWTATLGTKAEHNDYTGWEWEPSARLQWGLAPHQMLWTAVSRAVRIPSRVDHDLSEGVPPYLVILQGGADFASEEMTAYELGYRAELGPQVSVSASGYDDEYDDLRSTSYTPGTLLPFYFANNLKARTRGLEVGADWQALPWWRVHGGYDLLWEDVWVRPGAFDLNHALNETADPPGRAVLRSAMDLRGGVQLDASLRWVDARPINDNGVLAKDPAYWEADARIAWRATRRLELSLDGQNLLHRWHVEYGVPGPELEEIGRTVYGEATWRY